MKIVLQRVARASVSVNGEVIASINKGLLVLFGVEKFDGNEKIDFLVEKTLHLRIFPDENGKMNLSCLDIRGEVLVVSQFTLAADCQKGRRPGFDNAAATAEAKILYKNFIEQFQCLDSKLLPASLGQICKYN